MTYFKTHLIYIYLVFLFFNNMLFAQEKSQNQIKVLSQSSKDILIQFSLEDLEIKDKLVKTEKFQYLEAPNLKLTYKKGAPDILRCSFSLSIPNMEWWNKIEILSSDYTDYENINLLPSRGLIYRNQNPKDIPYKKGKVYKGNYFYPANIISVSDPFIFRDYRGESVSLYPIQYNPVTKVLRVYHTLKIRLSSKGMKGINPLVRKKKTIDKEFAHLYKKLFVNQQAERYPIVEETGSLLIITPDDYLQDVRLLANWKRQAGIPTEIVSLTTTGSSAEEIKDYIKSYYNFYNLTYVLLIGDYEDLPNLYSHGDSDPSYAQVDGTDHYPDIIVGRFSVVNRGQLYRMMNKTIWYEKDIQTDADWLSKAIGIADNSGTLGDDGETDVQHMDNIKQKLLKYTYTSVDSAYEKYGITAAKLSAYINEGRGFINYVGHGADDKWVTSNLSIGHLDTIHNFNKLPFIFDVACVNGNFKDQTCFAEEWMRTKEIDSFVGAVAIVASTVNQPWDPPMDGQDEMVDILTESYQNNIKRTFGGIVYNGAMHMLDQYPDDAAGQLTIDTWTIFGDPSLHIRTKAPEILTINHNDSIIIGDNHFNVSVDKENVLVSLSKLNNNSIEFLNAQLINNTTESIIIPAFTQKDTMIVTATGYNMVTVIDTVYAVKPNGPFVIFDSFSIDDSTENNNAKADFQETVYLNVKLKNVGIATAYNITADLSSTNSYFNIIENNFSCDSLEMDVDSIFTKKYKVHFSDSIPDQEKLNLNIQIKYDTNVVYNSLFNIVCNAPKLSLELESIKDSINGNNNGRLDSSETVQLVLKAKNIGHIKTKSVFLKSTNASYFNFIVDSVYTDSLLNNQEKLLALTGVVAKNIPYKSYTDLNFVLSSGKYNVELDKHLPINISLEDWEGTSTTDSFNWEFSGDLPWEITADQVYEGDSAIVSGKIRDNQRSILYIRVTVLKGDTLSFYKKVSCENSPYSAYDSWYDYFQFDIDSERKGRWDGEINWSKEKYYIPEGKHTYTWKYVKDNTDFGGNDCVWLDYIVFPENQWISTIIAYQSADLDDSFNFYPNPTKNNLNIRYSLKESSYVKIDILSITGKYIKTVLDDNQEAGAYTLQARNIHLSKGIYFLSFTTKTNHKVQKFVVE